MLENLRITSAIVAPFIIYLCIGMLLRKRGILDEEAAKRMNTLLFSLVMPANVFNSMYDADLSGVFRTPAAVYAALATLLSMFALMKINKLFSPDPAVQGAMTHSAYRGNVMLFALPIAEGVFGECPPEVLIVLTAVMITNNISAVPLMQHYRNEVRKFRGEALSEEKTGLLPLLKDLLKVPMLDGVLLGFIWALLKLPLPGVCETAVSSIAGCATPIAFITMGARIDFAHLKANSRNALIAAAFKLIIGPAVLLILPVAAGWGEESIVAMLAAFGSSSAVISYTMCEGYECDGELAGEIVAIGALFSLLTLFVWIFSFKQFGIIS